MRIDVVELNPHAPRPFVFTELALCLRDMLRAAGYEAEHVINQLDPEALAIVFVPTAGWQEALTKLDPARTVLFNMEQLGSDSPWAHEGYRRALAGWTVADYSTANAHHLRAKNGTGQRVHEIPIVPGPAVVFAPQGGAAREIDVLFYGTPNPRRERIFEGLRSAGLSVEVVAGAYAWELAPALHRARLVLHVHYYETRLFPVARMLQPIASAVPVVCESSVCPALSDWSDSGIVFAEYGDLVQACQDLLAQPQRQIDGVRRSLRLARCIDSATPLRKLVEAMPGAMAAAR